MVVLEVTVAAFADALTAALKSLAQPLFSRSACTPAIDAANRYAGVGVTDKKFRLPF
jgi:hypothetical protein